MSEYDEVESDAVRSILDVMSSKAATPDNQYARVMTAFALWCKDHGLDRMIDSAIGMLRFYQMETGRPDGEAALVLLGFLDCIKDDAMRATVIMTTMSTFIAMSANPDQMLALALEGLPRVHKASVAEVANMADRMPS